MHVVLLGTHGEVRQAPCYRVLAIDDVDLVIDHPARVHDPLPPHHELVVHIVAEGIPHPAVPAGQAHPASDRFEQPGFLLLRDAPHRPDGHDHAQRAQVVFLEVDVERVRNPDLKPIGLQMRREDLHTLLRLVAVPPAPNHQGLLHQNRSSETECEAQYSKAGGPGQSGAPLPAVPGARRAGEPRLSQRRDRLHPFVKTCIIRAKPRKTWAPSGLVPG